MNLSDILSIDHYNKKDLVVTVDVEYLLRVNRNRDINIIIALENTFNIELLKNHFDLSFDYKCEYFYICTPINRKAEILLKRL